MEFSLWKRIEYFSIHITPENLKKESKASIVGHFGPLFDKNSGREITRSVVQSSFRKDIFWEVYLYSTLSLAGVFNSSQTARRR